MESRLLEVFVLVAELGSFSKAAQRLYITPSAVIQQVNRLEDELGVRLLQRSKQGVKLTPAGEYLLREGGRLLKHLREMKDTLRTFDEQSRQTLILGSSFVRKSRVFSPLWQRFEPGRGWSVQTIDTSDIRRTWQQADIIECTDYGAPWHHSMRFTPLCTVPVALAASPSVLAPGQEALSWEDLRGKTLVTFAPGYSATLDALAAKARAMGMRVIESTRYDMYVFSMCEVNGYFLQVPLCWHDLYPSMRVLPCVWEYTLPYGFFCQKKPPQIIEDFLAFAATQQGIASLLGQAGAAHSP